MRIKEISENKVANISKYIISQMKDKSFLWKEWDNDIEEYSAHIIEIITYHSDITDKVIKGVIYLGNNKEYGDINTESFVDQIHCHIVEYFNDLILSDFYLDDGCWIEDLPKYSEIQLEIILEIIYNLTVEYELSPFERESIKCFGKNFFSGEEYNTTEFRELS